jgi:hypothetical protein
MAYSPIHADMVTPETANRIAEQFHAELDREPLETLKAK